MELDRYIEDIHTQLDAVARSGGEQARELADRLAAPLDSAIRLALQDALVAAAEEITVELAPGSVELRLRDREPTFVVTPPEAAEGFDDGDDDPAPGAGSPPVTDGDDAIARINVRMPEQLKARVDRAADRQGLSVNAWLVRAAAARLERAEGQRGHERRAPSRALHYKGWAR
ncbi:MAG TPA: toxin-antitoxin system HicB family antitoxin [Actinomycetota bacterium]|nr:toxin-antitoxin system HicB family antitoxin [Actinomycetota bacterium]